jgi:hypothetical protein
MVPWYEMAQEAPELARLGEQQLFQFGAGMAFLASVRKDGAPRLHPLFPVLSDGHLYVLISRSSPRKDDLLRDGRYALQAFPPPGDDATGEFYLAGRAAHIEDPVHYQQVLQDAKHRPRGDEECFELLIERAMFTTWESTGGGAPEPVRRMWTTRVLSPAPN